MAVETFLWQQSGTFTARYNRHRLEPSQATPIQTATSDRLAVDEGDKDDEVDEVDEDDKDEDDTGDEDEKFDEDDKHPNDKW